MPERVMDSGLVSGRLIRKIGRRPPRRLQRLVGAKAIRSLLNAFLREPAFTRIAGSLSFRRRVISPAPMMAWRTAARSVVGRRRRRLGV